MLTVNELFAGIGAFERILTQAIHSLLLSNQTQFSWIN